LEPKEKGDIKRHMPHGSSKRFHIGDKAKRDIKQEDSQPPVDDRTSQDGVALEVEVIRGRRGIFRHSDFFYE